MLVSSTGEPVALDQDFLISCLPKYELSYTCLSQDRAKFCKINEMCRKFCPILHISYMHEIHYHHLVLHKIAATD